MVEELSAAPVPVLPLQAAAYTCSNYRGRRRLLAPSTNVIPPSLALIHRRGPPCSSTAAGLGSERGGVRPLWLWAQGWAPLWTAPRASLTPCTGSSVCRQEGLAILRSPRAESVWVGDRLDGCCLQANLHFVPKQFPLRGGSFCNGV